MRPELEFKHGIDEEIEFAVDTRQRFGAWPDSLRQLWRTQTARRRRRELTFLNCMGLAWCVVCLAFDYIDGPDTFAAGLVLRLGLVAPLYLLAIAAALYGSWSAQRWTSVAAVPAFVGVVAYLGMHVATQQMQEYVMACGLLLAMAVIMLPLRLPVLALMVAISIAGLWLVWATLPVRGQDEFVLVAFISGIGFASLLEPFRTARLKDRTFLYGLRAQIVSARLLEANERLRALSDLDDLTGLPNRRYLERVFDSAFAASQDGDNAVAVVMIDVDHFKAFNDTYGHVAGDRTLAQVARVLHRKFSGPGRIVARYGGEEFMAVLEGVDEESALALANAARSAISKRPVSAGGSRGGAVTVSMGVALRRRADLSPTAMIERADAALYEAKNGGRNQVRLADDGEGKPPQPILKTRA